MDCLLAMASASRDKGVPRTVEAEIAAKATIVKNRDMLVLRRIPVWPECTQDRSQRTERSRARLNLSRYVAPFYTQSRNGDHIKGNDSRKMRV